jgi:hypothetical protein
MKTIKEQKTINVNLCGLFGVLVPHSYELFLGIMFEGTPQEFWFINFADNVHRNNGSKKYIQKIWKNLR